MTYIRRSGGQIALFILSLLGAGIAIYLTTVHYEHVPLVCSTSGLIDCERVLSSIYSVVPGTTVPITIPGLLWCLAFAALAFAAWRLWPQQRGLRIAELAWSLVGMLTVFYLVYVEIVRLHTICAWCTGLHVIILVMLLTTVVLLQEPEQDEEGEEAGADQPSVTAVRK